MRCSGCQRELEVGDRYIVDTASAFIGGDANPQVDGLVAEIMGGGSTGKVVFCEDCTVEGGEHVLETVYGDEEDG